MPKKERAEAVNEIRLLASLNNPHIIKYCDAFIEGSDLYIVTEVSCRGGLSNNPKP
jgi:NIMA (never in mitosis gene a)-related kinase